MRQSDLEKSVDLYLNCLFNLKLLYLFCTWTFEMSSRYHWPKYFCYLQVLLFMFAYFVAIQTLRDEYGIPLYIEQGKFQRVASQENVPQ